MSMDEAQKKAIADWLSQGDSLSQIQSKLKSELGISMTFMEVRFLIDDLDLELKKEESVETDQESEDESHTATGNPLEDAINGVSVEVDSIVTPGALVSGDVVFSDGVKAKWQLDQMGRLGLSNVEQGYQPSPEDIQDFQMQLQQALKQKGFA